MIRKLYHKNTSVIYQVINQAARAYRGVIPDDRYHEPYMLSQELRREMESMIFFGWEEEGQLVEVISFQPIKDVTLIRHAYVLPNYQRKGIGARLLTHLKQMTKTKCLLVDTAAK